MHMHTSLLRTPCAAEYIHVYACTGNQGWAQLTFKQRMHWVLQSLWQAPEGCRMYTWEERGGGIGVLSCRPEGTEGEVSSEGLLA